MRDLPVASLHSDTTNKSVITSGQPHSGNECKEAFAAELRCGRYPYLPLRPAPLAKALASAWREMLVKDDVYRAEASLRKTSAAHIRILRKYGIPTLELLLLLCLFGCPAGFPPPPLCRTNTISIGTLEQKCSLEGYFGDEFFSFCRMGTGDFFAPPGDVAAHSLTKRR